MSSLIELFYIIQYFTSIYSIYKSNIYQILFYFNSNSTFKNKDIYTIKFNYFLLYYKYQ